MASFGCVRIKEVRQALDACLPGCRWDKKKHYFWIYPPGGGASYHLPKGAHGKRDEAVEVERGHVKKMGRQFGCLDCLKREIEGL